MSHLTMGVFFIVLVGIYITHVAQAQFSPCESDWGSKCFIDETNLNPTPSCDSIVYNPDISGCQIIKPVYYGACCVDCSKQTEKCNSKWPYSVGRNVCCTFEPKSLGLHELKMGEIYPESGCSCCKYCIPKSRCKDRRRSHSRCITQADPVYNFTWCREHRGKIIQKHCEGEECYCCYRYRPWP